MSRRLFFFMAASIMILYFSVIIFNFIPLHGARVALYMDSTHFYASSSLRKRLLRMNPTMERRRIFMCKHLKWKAPGVCPVALASYPGSGNTWLRHLLQQSTGYMTGSIYNDSELYWNGFPGENKQDGSVLVVKTHGTKYYEPCFRAAIILIRNPKDAILAEFNRQNMGHIGTVVWTAFKPNLNTNDAKKNWPAFVSKGLEWWFDFHKVWLNQFLNPIHIVTYEGLVANTSDALSGVLNFLNETVTKADLECAIKNQEGIFRRKKKLDFDPYTEEMKRKITRVHKQVLRLLQAYELRRDKKSSTSATCIRATAGT